MTIKEIKPIVDMVRRINAINGCDPVSLYVNHKGGGLRNYCCEITVSALDIHAYSPEIFEAKQVIDYLTDTIEAFGLNTSG